jgi:hypothetical protein
MHPKRQLSSPVKIFIRALEIQCRNEWDHDMWQSAEEFRQDMAIGVEPVMPATPGEIAVLATIANRPSAAPTPGPGVDVVVDESTSLYRGADRDRDGLRRAHEQLKARNREPRTSIAPLMGLGEGFAVEASAELELADMPRPVVAPVPPANGEASRFNHKGEVNPVQLGEMGRPFPSITTFPDEVSRFDSVPGKVDGFELPLANRPAPERVVRRAGFDDELVSWSSPAPMADPLPVTSEPALDWPEPAAQPAPRVRGTIRTRPEPVAEPLVSETELLDPHLPVLAETELAGPEAKPQRLPRQSRPRFEESLEPPRRRPEPRTEPAPAPIAETAAVDRVEAEAIPEAILDLREDVVIEPAVEDHVVSAAASSVPRMCRTCRDFRPAEAGDRGWCTNKWAFSHRRMVDADELPCETSIGRWWLPHDDVWLGAVDVTAHSQPTPLLDHWMAQRAAANGEAEPAPPLRRRQR